MKRFTEEESTAQVVDLAEYRKAAGIRIGEGDVESSEFHALLEEFEAVFVRRNWWCGVDEAAYVRRVDVLDGADEVDLHLVLRRRRS